MDDTSAHTANLNQAEEESLTYTVSDEALKDGHLKFDSS
jgi:hypothetical protein